MIDQRVEDVMDQPLGRLTATGENGPISASVVSARIELLSEPPVLISPLPSLIIGPMFSLRATIAKLTALTTLARSSQLALGVVGKLQ